MQQSAPRREVDYAGGFEEIHSGLRDSFKSLLLSHAKASSNAFDVGCGAGRVALLLSSHVRHVVGVDRDAKAIEAARSRAKNLGRPNVEFHVGDVESTPWRRFGASGFDLAAANLCLSPQVIARAGVALNPGCEFVFSAFGPGHYEELGGSLFSMSEAAVRHAANQSGLLVGALSIEATAIRFKSLQEARAAVGDDRAKRWLANGRWDRLAANFDKGKRTLTESRLVGVLRRA